MASSSTLVGAGKLSQAGRQFHLVLHEDHQCGDIAGDQGNTAELTANTTSTAKRTVFFTSIRSDSTSAIEINVAVILSDRDEEKAKPATRNISLRSLSRRGNTL